MYFSHNLNIKWPYSLVLTCLTLWSQQLKVRTGIPSVWTVPKHPLHDSPYIHSTTVVCAYMLFSPGTHLRPLRPKKNGKLGTWEWTRSLAVPLQLSGTWGAHTVVDGYGYCLDWLREFVYQCSLKYIRSLQGPVTGGGGEWDGCDPMHSCQLLKK